MKTTSLLNKIFDRLLAKKGMVTSQAFYEHLLQLSLAGLNIGRGGDLKQSGEMYCLEYIRKKLADENALHPIIFDVGANEGEYAIATADNFKGIPCTIHCFEPSVSIFAKLQQNCSRIPNIILNNFGLTDAPGNNILFLNSEKTGLSSMYNRRLDHFGIELDKRESVIMHTIDGYCQEHNISKIDFLKIDIEGGELNALKGSSRMLDQKAIKNIQFEFGGCNIDSRTFFQDFYYLLTEKNYKINRILQDGLSEIRKYREVYEIFLNVNYLAELKND